ncbi:hypothetical protein [Halorarum salinum]|uniref:Uncharacterized protein n=1 Tax=Halorarum salinum TaxID=2743089 RepID=A0A7D5LCA0_9EURY|nr:hypothetical protein [Halobaculum salinum]QLG62569.1 hypothetical protein HUG12_12880 [Halobaculum salinum]
MRLARFGVLGTLAIALLTAGALATLLLAGPSRAGVGVTLALLVVAVGAAVLWGWRTAPRRWRTRYW